MTRGNRARALRRSTRPTTPARPRPLGLPRGQPDRPAATTRAGSRRSAAADEAVQLIAPTPGYYLVEAHVYVTESVTWDGHRCRHRRRRSLTATPNPLPVTEGTPTSYRCRGRASPDTRYFGVVLRRLGGAHGQVDSGRGAGATRSDHLGAAKVGKTLTAKPGTGTRGRHLRYQWLRDGSHRRRHGADLQGGRDAGTRCRSRAERRPGSGSGASSRGCGRRRGAERRRAVGRARPRDLRAVRERAG